MEILISLARRQTKIIHEIYILGYVDSIICDLHSVYDLENLRTAV